MYRSQSATLPVCTCVPYRSHSGSASRPRTAIPVRQCTARPFGASPRAMELERRPGAVQHAHAVSAVSAASAASASIVIAPPPVSLWARRIQYQRQDTLRPATASHLRADSCALGPEQPRILSRAHVTAATTPTTTTAASPFAHHEPVPSSPSSVYSSVYSSIYSVDGTPSPLSPPATPYCSISSPIGTPFYPKPEDYGGYRFARLPQRLSARMPLEILPRAHWLSRVRSCLRLLIIVLSGAVVFMLMHTLSIYRGNRYLELRKGEIPMVWPAHTNLAPTIILTAVAGANFLASVAILSLGFKRSFRRPIRSRDLYRIVAGSFGVVLWAAALVVFHLLDRASKASLGRYSCTNQHQVTNGRYQYLAVCEEQVGAPESPLPLPSHHSPPPLTYSCPRTSPSTPPSAPPPPSCSLSSPSPPQLSKPCAMSLRSPPSRSTRRRTRTTSAMAGGPHGPRRGSNSI